MKEALEALKRVDENVFRKGFDDYYVEHWDADIATIRAALSHWVSVKERLPEEGQAVIAWRPDDAHMPRKILVFKRGEFQNCVSTVTHWMPLPPPPEDQP